MSLCVSIIIIEVCTLCARRHNNIVNWTISKKPCYEKFIKNDEEVPVIDSQLIRPMSRPRQPPALPYHPAHPPSHTRSRSPPHPTEGNTTPAHSFNCTMSNKRRSHARLDGPFQYIIIFRKVR